MRYDHLSHHFKELCKDPLIEEMIKLSSSECIEVERYVGSDEMGVDLEAAE